MALPPYTLLPMFVLALFAKHASVVSLRCFLQKADKSRLNTPAFSSIVYRLLLRYFESLATKLYSICIGRNLPSKHQGLTDMFVHTLTHATGGLSSPRWLLSTMNTPADVAPKVVELRRDL